MLIGIGDALSLLIEKVKTSYPLIRSAFRAAPVKKQQVRHQICSELAGMMQKYRL